MTRATSHNPKPRAPRGDLHPHGILCDDFCSGVCELAQIMKPWYWCPRHSRMHAACHAFTICCTAAHWVHITQLASHTDSRYQMIFNHFDMQCGGWKRTHNPFSVAWPPGKRTSHTREQNLAKARPRQQPCCRNLLETPALKAGLNTNGIIPINPASTIPFHHRVVPAAVELLHVCDTTAALE